MSDIERWLNEHGLGGYAELFVKNKIDFDVLEQITLDELKELEIPLGDRKRILNAVAAGLSGVKSGPAAESAQPEQPVTRNAERRQLTVMFCDLVGSTALSTELDPEDYRRVLATYQSVATAAIARFDGYTARYMGDGLLVYFGYPRAHEDDAERAVRAGLAIVEDVKRADVAADFELQVRIGIATGLVVAGDIVGEGASEERAVLGETPNLAARLQGVAEPGAVVVSGFTWRLVEGRFEFEPLEPRRLKGISAPVQAYRAVEVRDTTRFEALHNQQLPPLVGRDEELAMLHRRWDHARRGEGQVVHLQGEPGIGKSRIVEALREVLSDESHALIRFQCSPYHVNSALHPVIAELERTAGIRREDGARQRVEKLEAALEDLLEADRLALALLAALLSLPTEGLPSIEMPPPRKRAETIALLVAMVERRARTLPVLVVVEDAHWIDPSTLEVIDALVHAVAALPVLLLITNRPEFEVPWVGHGHVTQHSLNRLGRRDGMAIVEQAAAGKQLPDEVVERIVDRTDGVPLFAEELTKAIIESDLLEERDDQFVLHGALPTRAVPSTLHDSLMARLDRLESAKDVAQTAAVLGRVFSMELLAQVCSLSDSELEDAVVHLVEAGIVFRRGSRETEQVFMFKHALVQDAAYQSLLNENRRLLHRRVAEVLESKYPDRVDTEPEVLAQHWTEAGQVGKAARSWCRAGERAAQRFANPEAIVNFNKALDLLDGEVNDTEADRLRLEIYSMLGPALLTRGFGVPEVRRAFQRMRELANAFGDSVRAFGASWGLWLHHHSRAEFPRARDYIEEMIEVADASGEPTFELEARHSAWATSVSVGEFESCRAHVERGLAGYDVQTRRKHPLPYVHDPAVCGAMHDAVSLWFLGYPDRAKTLSRDAIAQARELAHPHTVVTAHFFDLVVSQLARDAEAICANAPRVLELTAKNGPGHWHAAAQIIEGWAKVRRGDHVNGLDTSMRGSAAYEASGTSVRAPYYLGLMSEVYAHTGAPAEALAKVHEALAVSERTGESHWDAELHRLKGWLQAMHGEGEQSAQGEASIEGALSIARRQRARSLELRAAVTLAKLRVEHGNGAETMAALASVYDKFSEGFEKADLREAASLLGARGE